MRSETELPFHRREVSHDSHSVLALFLAFALLDWVINRGKIEKRVEVRPAALVGKIEKIELPKPG